MTTLSIPWPPTLNTYYRYVQTSSGARVLISRDGRAYRTAVQSAAINAGLTKNYQADCM